ncbi:hypothetical protein [Rhodococcus sp. IEGM 1408]|uniref:hypothetical protein n=1 Tax=Rhodococcus sp. IEGM 1408 TaxID=3082220 RepID=UPI002953359C|nr:hypothetical protein [Rhodococcus sp. IEGM 1408]MDV8000372.1 hypothetical protein [Rhodococcus sp. IEGM 1408]
MARKMTAGDKLVKHWHDELAKVATRMGATVEFDGYEIDILERMRGAEDRKSTLLALLDDPECSTSQALKISSEVRQLDMNIVRLGREIVVDPEAGRRTSGHAKLAGATGWTDSRRARLADKNRRVGGGA